MSSWSQLFSLLVGSYESHVERHPGHLLYVSLLDEPQSSYGRQCQIILLRKGLESILKKEPCHFFLIKIIRSRWSSQMLHKQTNKQTGFVIPWWGWCESNWCAMNFFPGIATRSHRFPLKGKFPLATVMSLRISWHSFWSRAYLQPMSALEVTTRLVGLWNNCQDRNNVFLFFPDWSLPLGNVLSSLRQHLHLWRSRQALEAKRK